MGYDTRYKLEIPGVDFVTRKRRVAQLRSQSEDAHYALDENGSGGDPWKWYEHEQDMRAFSKTCPKTLLILHGKGADAGDIWKEYYLDGKCQVAKAEIKIQEFDKRLLQ